MPKKKAKVKRVKKAKVKKVAKRKVTKAKVKKSTKGKKQARIFPLRQAFPYQTRMCRNSRTCSQKSLPWMLIKIRTTGLRILLCKERQSG